MNHPSWMTSQERERLRYIKSLEKELFNETEGLLRLENNPSIGNEAERKEATLKISILQKKYCHFVL